MRGGEHWNYILVNGNGLVNREQFVKRTCNVQIAQNGKKWQKPLESGFNHRRYERLENWRDRI